MEKLRAVIYNRCSTEEESQKDALIKQVQESKRCVHEQGWELVDAYVEAKSGTTVKGRNEYNRLYQDLESDKQNHKPVQRKGQPGQSQKAKERPEKHLCGIQNHSRTAFQRV